MIAESVVGSDEGENDSEVAEHINITTTNSCPRDQMLTDAQLLSKFKSVMNSHKSPSSKVTFWEFLTVAELNKKRNILWTTPGILGQVDEEFVSLHLPTNMPGKACSMHTVKPRLVYNNLKGNRVHPW
jgi:hypothetical protein